MLCCLPVALSAPITFVGSGVISSTGNAVSGTIRFALPGEAGCSAAAGSMCITITNTTAGGTLNRSDVLSGFFFDVGSANPTLTLASGTGTVVQNGLPPIANADLNFTSAGKGRYIVKGAPGTTLGTNINGVAFPYEYGVSTVGYSGIFNGGQVGNDDYAIVSVGTNLTVSGINSIPLVQTTATFVIAGFGTNSLSQIQNVTLGYGSLPDLLLTTTVQAPEPRMGASLLAALIIGGLAKWRGHPLP